MFMAAPFTVPKTQRQPKRPSTDEWIKKMWYVCTAENNSDIKKNEMLPSAAAQTDL